MIDIHTHTLPDVDDGSPDIETTAKMLCEQVKQGVNVMCFSPHFYASRMTKESFLKSRSAGLKRLQDADITEKPSMLISGAEVAYFPGISRAEILDDLCFENTRTILLEMPFEKWTADVINDAKTLITGRRLKVVLAHLERYTIIHGNKNGIKELMQFPFIVQVNAGSLLKGGSKRRHAISLLKEAQYAILASDCHNLTTRRPNISEGYKVAEEKVHAGFTAEANLLAKEIVS